VRGHEHGNQNAMTALVVKVPQIEAIIFHLNTSLAVVFPGADFELEDQDYVVGHNDRIDPLPAPGDRVLQEEVPVFWRLGKERLLQDRNLLAPCVQLFGG